MKTEPPNPMPCPFCNHAQINVVVATGGWLCKCNQCFARTTYLPSQEAAIEAWNYRAYPTPESVPSNHSEDKLDMVKASEISDNDLDAQIRYCVCNTDGGVDEMVDAIVVAVRPYLRTTEPVMSEATEALIAISQGKRNGKYYESYDSLKGVALQALREMGVSDAD